MRKITRRSALKRIGYGLGVVGAASASIPLASADEVVFDTWSASKTDSKFNERAIDHSSALTAYVFESRGNDSNAYWERPFEVGTNAQGRNITSSTLWDGLVNTRSVVTTSYENMEADVDEYHVGGGTIDSSTVADYSHAAGAMEELIGLLPHLGGALSIIELVDHLAHIFSGDPTQSNELYNRYFEWNKGDEIEPSDTEQGGLSTGSMPGVILVSQGNSI